MYLVNKVVFLHKLFFLYNKVKKLDIFEIDTYDDMIDTLCNPTKIKMVRKLLIDMITYVTTFIDYNLDIKTNYKVIKVFFLSFYIHNKEFTVWVAS